MAEIKGKDNFDVAPTVNGTTVSLDGHGHDHNALTNYVANKHIDHSTLTLTAGIGLSGGGILTASRTLNVDITELSADATPDGAADYAIVYDASAATHKKVLLENLPGAAGGGGVPPFTEEWTLLGRPSSASTWQTTAVAGAPANTVVQITIVNAIGNKVATVGARAVGSSLARYIEVSKGGGCVSFACKTDASSQIQWYTNEVDTAVKFYYGGAMA